MFTPRNLFANVPCADGQKCTRPHCPLGHIPNGEHEGLPLLPTSSHATPSKPTPPSSQPISRPLTPILKAPVRTDRASAIVPFKRPDAPSPAPASPNASIRRETTSNGVSPNKRQKTSLATSSHVAPSASRQPTASRSAAAGTSAGCPILRINAALSQVAIPVRQAMVKNLYEAFLSLYAPLLKENPGLPAEHALAQEQELYEKANKLTYRSAVILCVSNIKRRPKPTSISHDSVGTEGMRQKRRDEFDRLRSLTVTRKEIEGFVLPLNDMKQWGYMTEVPEGEGGNKPSDEGQVRDCERCGKAFVVKKREEAEECVFHWGRPQSVRINGEKARTYNCCGQPVSTGEGCTRGPHVFYESSPSQLHERQPFSTTRSPFVEGKDSALDVVAFDCEMIYSTAGITCARVSAVDGSGKKILDELVKLDDGVHVIDYNTRFSGIKDEEYKNAVLTLKAIRRSLDAFINSETILIGHALENDLKTLRMVHLRCVDTSVLYPHRSGPPYRKKLRDLALQHLDRKIQMGDRDGNAGHSSLEDSIATLDLVRQYILENRSKQVTGTAASQSCSNAHVGGPST